MAFVWELSEQVSFLENSSFPWITQLAKNFSSISMHNSLYNEVCKKTKSISVFESENLFRHFVLQEYCFHQSLTLLYGYK